MESIIRDVSALDEAQRHALEHVIGQQLQENQRLVIQVVSMDRPQETPAAGQSPGSDRLPDWCNVYEGLSDAEIADLEKSIVRSSESRSLV